MKVQANGLLPLKRSQDDCNVKGGCSLAGDLRVDENIALHSMHTVWVREHNRIASELKKINPGWNNKQLFQNARKITGAVWQHITYKEYLPLLVTLPRYSGYNANVDPSITNVFASAAFRFGHSLVPNKFSQLDNNFNKANPPIPLQEAFLNRHIINIRGIEQTVRGLIGNLSNVVDNKFSFGLTRRLFVSVDSEDYLDLTALNIQRGRDHGLPGYNEYRRLCGLSVPKTWAQVQRLMVANVASKFQKVYKHPDDIDVFAGGISERHIRNSQVGPTFNCILKRQFQSIRDGDRFYYENPGVFTVAQLNAIRKVTMASILCNTLKELVSVQPNVFFTPSKQSNTRKVCNSIPTLDLNPWKGNSVGDEPEEQMEDTANDWKVVDNDAFDETRNVNDVDNFPEILRSVLKNEVLNIVEDEMEDERRESFRKEKDEAFDRENYIFGDEDEDEDEERL